MSLIESDGVPKATLTQDSYKGTDGDLATVNDALSLVVGAASQSEAWIADKHWQLNWRDSDILYNSPRTVTDGAYGTNPNVQRFTVAKIVNSVVPQMHKGLFYEDPPMVIRPRPGTSERITDAHTSLYSYLLDFCNFQRETKAGLENKALFGTNIYKWGIDYYPIVKKTRKASQVSVPGVDGVQDSSQTVVLDEQPNVTNKTTLKLRPFFEHRLLDTVLVDPKCAVGDIRMADYVIDVRYMDYYQLKDLMDGNVDEDGKTLEGWSWPEDLKALWMPASAVGSAPSLATTELAFIEGVVPHAMVVSQTATPDLLFKKLEVMEYWDKRRKIIVLDRKKALFTGPNPFDKIPFLSSNWWNRPKSFYGMGLGTIVGQNQRVDQGTINAILKILSFGVNPVYMRNRDDNAPTQNITTGIGKIITVGDTTKAYKLLEQPKIDPQLWQALSESQSASESASGADQQLVQGSSAGPRSSMGRTAGGAATLAGASSTRLDGPLTNFILQVFEPFLYILHDLVFEYMSDADIIEVLGDERGKEFIKSADMQEFHDARMTFETLAGASLSAKHTMAQSLTLITQLLQNPAIQENLADINEEYIDMKPIIEMALTASEWKNTDDIVKKMTPEMKAKRAAASQAAQQQSKAAIATQTLQQKAANASQIEDQRSDNRIKNDLVRHSIENSSMSLAVNGEPNPNGL